MWQWVANPDRSATARNHGLFSRSGIALRKSLPVRCFYQPLAARQSPSRVPTGPKRPYETAGRDSTRFGGSSWFCVLLQACVADLEGRGDNITPRFLRRLNEFGLKCEQRFPYRARGRTGQVQSFKIHACLKVSEALDICAQ